MIGINVIGGDAEPGARTPGTGRYDAWNHVIEVRRAHLGAATGSTFDHPEGADKPFDPSFGVILDDALKRHEYDGLGRLIVTISPWPDPDGATAWGSGPERAERAERFYYDGIRRVQEITVTSASSSSPPVTALAREYIWGPGDGGGPAGVDELLAQFEGAPASETDPEVIVAIQGKPWWVLQDAGGDIVALCERPAPVSGVEQPARVVQYLAYEPYGGVIEALTLHPHPPLHAGHKGLFADRLDAGLADSGGNEIDRLVPSAEVVYRVRNRDYTPRFGRWNQRDPNATSMAVAGSAHFGQGLRGSLLSPDLGMMFGNGANLYGYLGAGPWDRHDHLGLHW